MNIYLNILAVQLNLLNKEFNKEMYLFIGKLTRAAGISRSSTIIIAYLIS